jgi:hypothetical protein
MIACPYALTPAERALMDKAATATYKAQRQYLNDAPLSHADFEDVQQEAAWAMFKAEAAGQSRSYIWAAGRKAACNCFMRQLRGRNPGCCLRIDGEDDEDLFLKTAEQPQTRGLGWLTDQELLALFRPIRKSDDSAMVDVILLRLLAEGLDNISIASCLGISEVGVKKRRQDIKRRLIALCQERGVEPPEYHSGGWRPAHAYGKKRSCWTFARKRKPWSPSGQGLPCGKELAQWNCHPKLNPPSTKWCSSSSPATCPPSSRSPPSSARANRSPRIAGA